MADVASDPALFPKDDTFNSLFSGEPGNEKNHRNLQVRLKLLAQLGDYARALGELVEADFPQDVDTASANLHGALRGLSDTYQEIAQAPAPLTPQHLGLIATAVDALGKAIVESKRRKALREVIVQSDPAVQAAAALIARELGPETEIARFVHENVRNVEGSLKTAYNQRRSDADFDFQGRLELLTTIRAVHERAMASPSFFGAISSSAERLGKAHTALREAVTRKDFEFADAVGAISELVVHARSVKDFYDKIERGR